ncbi:MAG TPA: hypothetical protein VKU84_16945 [Stellaceae bacterium]|nr:hypothetical protein [Stellaceae bacterium]
MTAKLIAALPDLVKLGQIVHSADRMDRGVAVPWEGLSEVGQRARIEVARAVVAGIVEEFDPELESPISRALAAMLRPVEAKPEAAPAAA